MDSHFHDISIALYQQTGAGGPELLAHTFSRVEGARERVDFVMRTMRVLGGMEPTTGDGERLRFPCGAVHTSATKRLFLEASKVLPAEDLAPRPLSIFDKKSSAHVTVAGMGDGNYQLSTDGESEKAAERRGAIAVGLVKLAELEWVDEEAGKVAFSCGHAHDELIGLLLPRALNVRSFLRQQEMAAARGRLLAPSAQEQ